MKKTGKIIIGVSVIALVAGGTTLGYILGKQQTKNNSNENATEDYVQNMVVSVENNNTAIDKNNSTNQNTVIEEQKIQNEASGNIDDYKSIANDAIKKYIKETFMSNSLKNKFIKIKDIKNSPAYIIDSNNKGNHTISLIMYDGSKVTNKSKAIDNSKHKSIRVDAESNILVLGDFRGYINNGYAEDDVSLCLITENGFEEYGASGEVPSLNGQAISYGSFKSRTESIKEKNIELELNDTNVNQYIK